MTTTHANIADTVAAVLRDGMRQIKNRGDLVNEASTLSLVIQPALDALGYPATHRIPEYGEQRNRLDEACFLNEVSSSPGHAAVIVEAKEFGTNFDKSSGNFNSPDRQIQRYLKQHPASGPNTLGVLTDGGKWRIYRRAGTATNPDVEFLVEHNYQPLADPQQTALEGFDVDLRKRLEALVDQLARPNIAFRTVRRRAPQQINPADQLFAAISQNFDPGSIIVELLGEKDAIVQTDISEDVTLQGVQQDIHDTDWESYAYNAGIALKTDSPSLDGDRVVVGAVKYRHNPNLEMRRPDVAICARIFARASNANAAVVFAFVVSPDDTVEARLAVAANGQVNMTAAFDPSLPSPSARASIGELLNTIREPGDSLTVDKLLAPLEAAALRQRFYREVAQWTGRMQKDKTRAQRQAILRHLIRVMFAWILKEDEGINYIQPELFERAFVAAHLDDVNSYHKDVLRFLFHRRLNVPVDQRDDHPAPAINDAMEETRFLNGSLFAEHSDDDSVDIPADDYWGTEEKEPGLFTILSRYRWTMDEHRPGESEQTLDPELLSNLFERLIAPTEEGTAPSTKQPGGAYYTPADVADEMVKDALAAAVRDYVPPSVGDAELLDLFGNLDAGFPHLSSTETSKLVGRIKELRVFDPAVGSGEFLFSTLLALQRALGKLEPDAPSPVADIIRLQLAAQDIHPLAVQIARLRLFIAISASRKNAATDQPLPNLEARIVCADTLATVADTSWRPDQFGQLDATDPEIVGALTAVAQNRAKWYDAHTEEDKQLLLAADGSLRENLKLVLSEKGALASPELVGFADSPLYDVNPTPAYTDPRLIFYEEDWKGFDIVIGNPPYTDLDEQTTEILTEHKRYRSTNVGDTYTLFCETGLALANPDGGVVTMVVPLSLAFGQKQRSIRTIFEQHCREINLRHYDNIPDTIFNGTPTLKSWKNRQRATIITGVLGSPTPTVKSTGLQSWFTEDRGQCLAQRNTSRGVELGAGIDWRVGSQWLRIPTPHVADMVRAIIQQSNTIANYRYKGDGGKLLSFPETAYQFIGTVPEGTVSPRGETAIKVKDEDTLRLLMASLNGHIGYAWWWIVGDGFHVKHASDFGAFAIPDAWVENPANAIILGEKLLDAVPDCITEKLNAGTVWQNVNFHLKPDLIAELDRQHLAALGLPEEPLLTQLRIMRSSSSWNYGPV